ncbi:MAG TPA: hypothetical protein VMC10_11420 [Stellaceae bacterium]|nr:hypothetical protein [Stellaceae bacterium]
MAAAFFFFATFRFGFAAFLAFFFVASFRRAPFAAALREAFFLDAFLFFALAIICLLCGVGVSESIPPTFGLVNRS